MERALAPSSLVLSRWADAAEDPLKYALNAEQLWPRGADSVGVGGAGMGAGAGARISARCVPSA